MLKRFLPRVWWTFGGIAGWVLIVILTLLPGQDRPHTGYGGISEHVLAYALVAFCLAAGSAGTRQAILCLSALLLTSVAGELAQTQIPGRTAEIAGVVSAFAGIGLAGLLASADTLWANRTNLNP